jgi:PAS domain S-box-containing protein
MTKETKHILIIEDDKIDQMAFERFAKASLFPFTYLLVDSISEAKNAFQNNRFDVIVTDYFLGDGTAFEILELVKDIPIVVVTGTGSEEIAVDAIKKGAYDYLIKDVEGNYLMMLPITVQNALHRFQSERELHAYHENLAQLVEKQTAVLKNEIEVRKKAEEKLKKKEAHLYTLIETIPDLVWMKDLKGTYLICNRRFENFFGTPVSDIVGKTDYDFVDKKLADSFRENDKKAIADGDARMNEEEVVFANDGHREVLETIKTPVYDSTGAIIGVLGIARNITQRKQAEEKITKLSTAVEQSPSTIVINDLKGNMEYVNPKFVELTGYSSKEVIGKNARILRSGEHSPEFYKAFWRTISSGEIWRGEFHNKKKNGELFWESASISPIFNKQGKIINYIKVAEDTTQKKHAEDDLRESRDQYLSLFNQIADPIIVFDQASKMILDCNNATVQKYGYSLRELTKMTPLELHSDDKDNDLVKQNINDKEESSPNEYQHKGKDGTLFYVETHTQEILYMGVNAWITIIRDVTERKNANLKLSKALQQATESDRLKSAFLATMSHELRTPLNAIIGFSDIIEGNLDFDEINEFARIVNSSGKHLLNIVEDLFDITLIETGEIKVFKEDVVLKTILDDVKKIVWGELQQTKKEHIEFLLKTPPLNDGLVLNTDSSKLKQILINLLKNALKFTHRGHVHFGFEIEMAGEQRRIKFFVEDTGIGIPEEKKEFIFNVFRQADDTHTRTYGGTGIGLSISKRLVEYLGGKIWLDSKVGMGTTFYFTMPCDCPEIAVPVPRSESKIKKLRLGKTILIAEDVEDSFLFLQIVLEKSGHRVIWAKNGEEAVQLCKENNTIDLVLMDINMPVMKGYEATREIKKLRPQLPIIAQTAFAIAGDRKKSIAAGCDDYISKPINKKMLLDKIEKCFEDDDS